MSGNDILARDANRITVLGAVTNDANQFVRPILVDPTSGRVLASAIGTGGGDVAGPGSSTDNAVVRWDGTAGTLVQDSSVIVDDSNNVTGMTTLTLPNTGLHLLDTNATHDLIIIPGSNLTADRNFTITTGDAARTLSMAGNLVIAATFTTVGANTITLTTTGVTALTLPTSGTLTTTSDNLGVFATTTSAQLASVISNETGSGLLVFNDTPTLVTPVLGVATATSINGLTLTASTGTITVTNSKTLTVSNNADVSGTNTGDQLTFKTIAVSGQSDIVADGIADTLTIASGSNITLTTDAETDTLTITAATSTGATTALDNLSSVNINSALLFQTGIDVGSTVKPLRNLYLYGTGTYGTTSIKLTGAPTSARVVTFPDTDTTIPIVTQTVTIAGPTASRTYTFPDASTTVVGLTDTQALTNKTYNGNTFTAGTGVLTIAASKTLTVSNTLTLAGTDSTTMTFPTTTATIARTDAGQTFTGVNVFTSPKIVTQISDTNGNELIILTATASAVNEWTLANGATGVNPKLTASGETNVGLDFLAKGTGTFRFLGNSTQAAQIRLYEDTDNGTNYSAFRVGTQAADITYTLPTAVGAAGTFLKDAAGNGTLSWASPPGVSKSAFTATRSSTAANGSVTYAHGLGTTPTWVTATIATQAAAGSGTTTSYGTWDGTNNKAIYTLAGTTSGQTDASNCIVYSDTGGSQAGAVSAADATNITITWTKTSSPGSTTIAILFTAMT